jgi:glucose-6-phosphate 1-epimerase
VMTNAGSSPLRFEEALHAYYSVGDVAKAEISGLDGTPYLDKTDSFRKKMQSGNVIIERETDRVYLNTEGPLELVDPVLQRRITVNKQNSRNTVIWNPWREKGDALADLGPDQWKKMLCVEVANVGINAINLAPGEQHTMTARVSVSSS